MFKENNIIYRALFNNASEGLLVIDKQGFIKLTNPGLDKMFGYSEEKLIDKHIEVLVPDKYKESHNKKINDYFQQLSDRKLGSSEITLEGKHQDGSTFPIEVSLNHFLINESPLTMAIISDITQRYIACLLYTSDAADD